MSNIINLPDYKVVQVEDHELNYQIQAEVAEPTKFCPHCNNSNIVGFGRREEVVIDIPLHGKRTSIILNRRRYRCQSCSKTFLESVPHKNDKRQMTNRLIQYIEYESMCRTFSSVAEDIGVDEKTVRNIFNDYYERLDKTLKYELPQLLGIEEMQIIKPRCVITNIDKQTLVDILYDRNKTTLASYLSKFTDRDQIRYVVMNMWRPHRQTVESMIPNAIVIIDKSHALKMANDCLEQIRKDIRSGLTTQQRRGLMRDRFILLKRRHELTEDESMQILRWSLSYSELGHGYQLKEEFFEIWDCKTRNEAQEAYGAWLKQITSKMKGYFNPLIIAMDNWYDDIFAYFDHNITNAYTESLKNLVHAVSRIQRGYSFESLRAKILFPENLHKIKRNVGQIRLYDLSKTNYGVDISTLVKQIL